MVCFCSCSYIKSNETKNEEQRRERERKRRERGKTEARQCLLALEKLLLPRVSFLWFSDAGCYLGNVGCGSFGLLLGVQRHVA